MTYTRARWILSWGQILLILTACVLGILWKFPAWIESQFTSIPGFLSIGIFLLTFVAIHIPGDLMGGYFLPKMYGKKMMPFGKWFSGWVWGMLIQLGLLWAIAGVLYGLSNWLGIWGAAGGLAIIMMFLTGFQLYIAQLIGRFTFKVDSHKGRPILYFNNRDVRFTGGISGIPGKESIVLPQSWQRHFSQAMQEMLLARRHGAINTGTHGKGIFYAFLSNALFFAAALFLIEYPIDSVSGIVSVSLWFTLISVIGLFLGLPLISRKAVYEIDRWAYFHGGDPDVLKKSFSKTGAFQYPEPASIPTIARPFFSLPTASMRSKNMETQKDHKGGWQAERMGIYLSWAGLNLLCRSFHYNLGRPELWVFLPGD